MTELTRFPEEPGTIQAKHVIIHEYYEKVDGEVFHYWKFEHQQEFTKEKVPFTNIPYVKWHSQ